MSEHGFAMPRPGSPEPPANGTAPDEPKPLSPMISEVALRTPLVSS